MAKNAFNPEDYVGKKITSISELGNGYSRLTLSDGLGLLVQLVPMAITVKVEKSETVEEEKAPKKSKKAKEEEVDEGPSIDDMKEALIEAGHKKKAVNKMDDDEVKEAYDELETVDDDDDPSIDDMKEALIEAGHKKKAVNNMDDDEVKEAYDELEKDEPGEEEEDALTADDLNDADFDELEDISDDHPEWEIDIEDYDADDEKSVNKLRKEIAKKLGLKL